MRSRQILKAFGFDFVIWKCISSSGNVNFIAANKMKLKPTGFFKIFQVQCIADMYSCLTEFLDLFQGPHGRSDY